MATTDTGRPFFQHRHYKLIADIIAMCPDETMREGMGRLFAHGLQGTNSHFDKERFLAAAMRKPINYRDK